MKKSILKLTNIFHIRCRQREPNSDACGVFLCVLFYIMEILMFHLMKDETAALFTARNCTRGNLKLETAATWIRVTITESWDDRTLMCGITRSAGQHTRENKKWKERDETPTRLCSTCSISSLDTVNRLRNLLLLVLNYNHTEHAHECSQLSVTRIHMAAVSSFKLPRVQFNLTLQFNLTI